MQETQVQFLGLEDPLEKENGNPLQYSRLENPMDRGAWQASLSMGFPRQDLGVGCHFPSPGDLPNLGIEPESPAMQADALLLSHWGSP